MRAVIGLGGNLGSVRATFECAIRLLERHARVEARSHLYRSEAMGPPQPAYLNAAVRARTELSPHALLDELRAIERTLGRVRRERWGARTLDLDVLVIEDQTIDDDRLTVPHPGLFERAFALAPLADVWPKATPEMIAALARLRAPERIEWTVDVRVTRSGGRTEIEAAGLDRADALAALAAWPSDPGAIDRVLAFELASLDYPAIHAALAPADISAVAATLTPPSILHVLASARRKRWARVVEARDDDAQRVRIVLEDPEE
jgi:2-amino-4-hydroxy-6-hydroxymethyldihydropteridine diphosphokinase